jgi:hypothetical protein
MFPGFPAVRPPAAALAVGTRDDLAQRRFVPVRQLHLVDVAARGHTWRAPCAGTTTGKAHSADDRGPPVIVGRWCDSGLGFAGKWTQRLLALVTIASISSRSPSAVLHARWWPGLFKVDPKSASTARSNGPRFDTTNSGWCSLGDSHLGGVHPKPRRGVPQNGDASTLWQASLPLERRADLPMAYDPDSGLIIARGRAAQSQTQTRRDCAPCSTRSANYSAPFACQSGSGRTDSHRSRSALTIRPHGSAHWPPSARSVATAAAGAALIA